jgi:hypothetical protein
LEAGTSDDRQPVPLPRHGANDARKAAAGSIIRGDRPVTPARRVEASVRHHPGVEKTGFPAIGSGVLTVRMPSAPPDLYVRWITWWRTVEQAMLRDPRLEDLASEMSEPFLAGAVALFISEMASSLHDQAVEAESLGLDLVEPEVAGPMQFWEEAAQYLETRSTWLDRVLSADPPPGLAGVQPLDPKLRVLRVRVIEHVRSAVGTPISRG